MLLHLIAATIASAQAPSSTLSVDTGNGWRTWWRSQAAPLEWRAPSAILTSAVRWRSISAGVDHAEIRISGSGEAWRLRLVLLRFDPHNVSLELQQLTRDEGTLGAWTVDSVRLDALAAVNAGQFSSGHPWGWLVRNGVEQQAPAVGPLSMAFVVDSAGGARLVPVDSIASSRGRVRHAFQSYPTLLNNDGLVPSALRTPGLVDLDHRDSRVAIGQLRDGRMLIVLTRFEALGGVLSELPFGPTIPEMSALMGALGCSSAVALDGGISGQLMIRRGSSRTAWPAYRRVPLGLVIYPR